MKKAVTTSFSSSSLLVALLFIARLVLTSQNCMTSEDGVVLRNHVYRTMMSRNGLDCYKECRDDVRCQSLNYYIDDVKCELNTRTKKMRSRDVQPKERAIYFENPNRVPLGSVQGAPALSCQEINEVEKDSASGRYWLEPRPPNKAAEVFCNMTTQEATECYNSPCMNGGECIIVPHPKIFRCACPSGYTGEYCETVTESECSSYIQLKESDRHPSVNSSSRCDKNLLRFPAWYRISENAGSIVTNRCVSRGSCGSKYPGWMNGTMPGEHDGIVPRTICFHKLSCCDDPIRVVVKNCGSFFVYHLVSLPNCDFGYCGGS